MRRYFAVAIILTGLGALLLWQWSREREMARCLMDGHTWNGPASRCEAPANRPILKRDIERG